MKKQDWLLGAGGGVLFVLALVFEYSGVSQRMGIPESLFLIAVTFFFALYRPAWAFFLLIVLLPLETFSLLPESLGFRLRPYQLLTGCLYAALAVRLIAQRLPVGWFRLVWADWLLLVFGASAIISTITSAHQTQSLKQVLIVWSFLLLYFLMRYFVRSERDIRRTLPFVFASSLFVFGFALWQSIRGVLGQASFTAMVGRPNSSFTEADWLGLFGVLLMSIFLAIIGKKQLKQPVQSMVPQVFLEWIGWWGLVVGATLLLVITVTRSAWLASGVVVILFVIWVVARCSREREAWISGMMKVGGVLFALIIGIVIGTYLTPFSLTQRAISTGGWQTITVACTQPLTRSLPETITNLDELSAYRCRFINLEAIPLEQQRGNLIATVKRPDPNVVTRSNIYAQVRKVLQAHPIFGIGWGAIGDILGRDASGNALNASNMFLEVWLGSGIIGTLVFSLVWFGVGILALWHLWQEDFDKKFPDMPLSLLQPFPKDTSGVQSSGTLLFVAFSWCGLTLFNLFNSGILLGFIWIWLAVAVGVVTQRNKTVI